MDSLIRFAERNWWAAFGIGVTVALWLLGGIEETIQDDVYRELPDFATTDDEIAFHKQRLQHLQEIKAANKTTDSLVDELLNVVEILQRDVSELKLKARESHEHQK